MALPIVAIVGRPNVGKSSLLNRIAERMVSIVEPTAGVTRDRVSVICSIRDELYYELVDTGGYGIEDRDDLTEQIERQIFLAVEQAALILFVVDAKAGITPLDQRVARLLRKHADHVVLIANKVDVPAQEALAGELARLGFGEPLAVSALEGYGRTDLLEEIERRLAGRATELPEEPIMKVAVVGKRNTGKSTFINALAGEERVIASEKPGTTRDAIDVYFRKDGRTIVAIDTAGLRKKSKLADSIEFYSYSRAEHSVRRADVVLFFIDAVAPISRVDKRLGMFIAAEHKPCVLVINKWDLAQEHITTDQLDDYLVKTVPQLDYAPVVFTTAKDNHNVDAAIDVAWSLHKQAGLRLGTGQLNAALDAALRETQAALKRGARAPKVYFATQVAVRPPTLVLFVNDPARIDRQYERFLQNRLRECLPFEEVPIRLIFRPRRASARHAGAGPGGLRPQRTRREGR